MFAEPIFDNESSPSIAGDSHFGHVNGHANHEDRYQKRDVEAVRQPVSLNFPSGPPSSLSSKRRDRSPRPFYPQSPAMTASTPSLLSPRMKGRETLLILLLVSLTTLH